MAEAVFETQRHLQDRPGGGTVTLHPHSLGARKVVVERKGRKRGRWTKREGTRERMSRYKLMMEGERREGRREIRRQ